MPANTTNERRRSRRRVKAGARAAELARRGDRLLRAVCHDLRAPLASVTMGASFVMKALPPGEDATRTRRVLEAMVRSCEHMERLIRMLSDFTEIEAGGLELRLDRQDARVLLELAAAPVRELAEARAVRLSVLEPTAPVIVECDRERLLRAIEHVVRRAVEGAPRGGEVVLAVEERGSDVRATVERRGPALPDERGEALFDRASYVEGAKRGGAGFGMPVARGFAEAHGGSLTLDASAADETVFTFCLPRRATTERDARPRRPRP